MGWELVSQYLDVYSALNKGPGEDRVQFTCLDPCKSKISCRHLHLTSWIKPWMIESPNTCLQVSFINTCLYILISLQGKLHFAPKSLIPLAPWAAYLVSWVSGSCTKHLFPTHFSLLFFPVVGCILSSLLPAAVFQVTTFPSSSSFISSLKSIFPQASSCPDLSAFGCDVGASHTGNNLKTNCGL